MKDSIGTTQVREFSFTRDEILAIVLENIRHRGPPSYDFDVHRPWILWDEKSGSLKLRFIQQEFSREYSGREHHWKPFLRINTVGTATVETPASPTPAHEGEPT